VGKVLSLNEAALFLEKQKKNGKKIVFTNGCFDIIHKGHIEYLQKAKALGDILVIGLNSDESVRRLKGPERPVMPEEDRAYILSHIVGVDVVCVFNEDTPHKIIKTLVPDILVKGAEYELHEIVGRDVVEGAGGKVVRVPMIEGRSTRNLIKKIAETFK